MSGTLGVAATLLVGGGALAVTVPSAHAAPLDADAYGVTALIVVDGVVTVDLDPTPAVACPPDADDAEVDLDVGGGSLTASALTIACSTTDGVVTSTASVADLTVIDEVAAGAVESECSANGDPSGSATVTDLVVAGVDIEATGAPNQVVAIPAVGSVTINRQAVVDNADGTSTITVDALVIDLDPALEDTSVDAIVSSVSCTSSVVAPPTTAPPAPAPPPGPPADVIAPPAAPVTRQPSYTG